MTNPTSNFGWQMPEPTDLVTNLPADFEVFGQAVDTDFADLLGGTTGQVLSKTSATDLDFTWIANDQGDITAVTVTSPITGGGTSGSVGIAIQDGTTAQKGAVQLENSTSSTSTTTAAVPANVKTSYDLAAAAIPKSTGTTAGDLIYYTGASTPVRLGIGSASQVLTVASGVPSWATPAGGGGGKVLQVVQGTLTGAIGYNGTTFADTGLTVSITPTLNTSKVLVLVSLNGIGKYVGGGVTQSVATVIVRNSTNVFYGGDRLAYTGSAATNMVSQTMNYLDSPATTSATTYKVQWKSMVSGQDVVINDYTTSNTTTCSIIALEIGA
jgi:hypothetical protein